MGAGRQGLRLHAGAVSERCHEHDQQPARAVTRDAIAGTYERIAPHIRRTPVLAIAAEDFGLAGGALSLKLELTQHSGSFKARGAFANLLMREVPPAGVAAASGGNHGAAVAYAARRLGHKARIFVPEISSPAKIARIRGYGADLAVGRQGLCRSAGGVRGLYRRDGRALRARVRPGRDHAGSGQRRPRARDARCPISIRCWSLSAAAA